MMPNIFPVACHTDHVGPGSTFVAITGMHNDGSKYIALALEKGAQKIIVGQPVSRDVEQLIHQYGAELIEVSNARQALAQESARALNFPAHKLRILGVTGTKGKTTTVFVLERILATAGYRTGRISSAGNSINGQELKAALTTPQPDYIQVFFNECIKQGVTHVVMEIAAQAVSCHRIDGLELDGVIFTNFSREHGEFYATQQEYFQAKRQLIHHLKKDAPLILNADDEQVSRLTQDYAHTFTFGLHAGDYRISSSVSNLEGLSLSLIWQQRSLSLFCPTLLGTFNAYNIAGAIACALQLGVKEEILREALCQLPGIPGRLNPRQAIKLPSGALVFIDKAHNPSSFEASLSALHELTPHLIIVFGAGGERDKAKRPLMGSYAARYGDVVILTSDDPRAEDPATIIADILEGIEHKNKVICEIDRKRAIEQACSQGKAESIIAILGKGSEEYQQIGTVKHYFNERAIVDAYARSLSTTSTPS